MGRAVATANCPIYLPPPFTSLAHSEEIVRTNFMALHSLACEKEDWVQRMWTLMSLHPGGLDYKHSGKFILRAERQSLKTLTPALSQRGEGGSGKCVEAGRIDGGPEADSHAHAEP